MWEYLKRHPEQFCETFKSQITAMTGDELAVHPLIFGS